MSRRILITDDSPAIHETVRKLLAPDGHRLFHMNSGSETLEMLDEISPDMAIVDINMPGMGGLELIARLHKLRPELPVVVLSAEPSVEMRRAARKIGAVAWLNKPPCPATLRSAASLVRSARLPATG